MAIDPKFIQQLVADQVGKKTTQTNTRERTAGPRPENLPMIDSGKAGSPVYTTPPPRQEVQRTPTTVNKAPSTGGGGGGGSSSSSTSIDYGALAGLIPESQLKLMSGKEVADLYGYIYGEDEIYKRLQEATNAKFDEWGKQTEMLRDQSLTDYASNFDMYQSQARQARQNAMRTGLSKGSTIAAEVLSQIGAQRQGADNQAGYQQAMGELAAQRGSQLAYDKVNAMNSQNELAALLGNQSINQYGNEVQNRAAEMSLLGQYAQAESNTKSAQIMADAQRYAANRASSYSSSGSSGNSNTPALGSLGINAEQEKALKAAGYTEAEIIRMFLNPNDAAAIHADVQKRKTPPKETNPYSVPLTSNSQDLFNFRYGNQIRSVSKTPPKETNPYSVPLTSNSQDLFNFRYGNQIRSVSKK